MNLMGIVQRRWRWRLTKIDGGGLIVECHIASSLQRRGEFTMDSFGSSIRCAAMNHLMTGALIGDELVR
jgi:hypothetical protein